MNCLLWFVWLMLAFYCSLWCCVAANAAVSQGHRSLSVIVSTHSPCFLSLYPCSLVLQAICACNQRFTLKTSFENALNSNGLVLYLFTFIPLGAEQKGDVMRSATHNFLGGTVCILNRCVCHVQSPSRHAAYLEIARCLIHIKKQKRKKKKPWSETRHSHHASYECDRSGWMMMPAVWRLSYSFLIMLSPLTGEGVLLGRHQSISESNRRPSYLIIPMLHGYS